MKKTDKPLKLTGERVWRTYIGGREIGHLHGDCAATDDHFPEEWMYSITKAFNAGREDIEEGICKLAESANISLKELIEAHPEEMLGKDHLEKWGATTGVLIKMIDSQERLTIQVHPDQETAKRLFQSQFGKTECWYILNTRSDGAEPPCIYLGFKEGITKEKWAEYFEQQNLSEMLSLLNKIPVKNGETYLVKGGVPHAIGSGCMIIEIQEPTDYTIRVEKTTPSGFKIDDAMCHQGLGFEAMFDCFDYRGMSLAEVKAAFCIQPKKMNEAYQIISYEDTPCFQVERLDIKDRCDLKGEGIFYCLYILSGEGTLSCGTQNDSLKRNDQFFIPAVSEPYSITGSAVEPVSLLIMRGPIVKSAHKSSK